MSKTKNIVVDVDIELEEWGNDELIEEMKDRGFECRLVGESVESYAMQMHEARDDPDKLMKIVKEFVYDHVGKLI